MGCTTGKSGAGMYAHIHRSFGHLSHYSWSPNSATTYLLYRFIYLYLSPSPHAVLSPFTGLKRIFCWSGSTKPRLPSPQPLLTQLTSPFRRYCQNCNCNDFKTNTHTRTPQAVRCYEPSMESRNYRAIHETFQI